MSADANPTSQGDLTNFEVAQGGEAGAPTCTRCSRQITSTYHEANGAIVCSSCRGQLEAAFNGGAGARRFGRAVAYGMGGAALGALLYFAVLKLTGYEIGLIAIAVGFLVGGGVHKGSGGRGGWKYQTLAVALTYSAIVVTYIPFIIEEFRDAPSEASSLVDSLGVSDDVSSAGAEAGDRVARIADPGDAAAGTATDASTSGATIASGDSAAAASVAHAGLGVVVLGFMLLFALAAVSPVLAGIDNIIGLLIIGFALYQAWSMNRRVEIRFTGPYRVGQPRTSGDAAPA